MYKQFIIIIFLQFIIIHIINAQTFNLDATTNLTTQSICNATIYDSGGPSGSYQNSENYTMTFCSNNGQCLTVHFTSFDTETNFDFVRIYDGNSISSNLLAVLDGSTIPPDVTSSSTCITINFSSDMSVTYTGFSATVTCTTACYVPPPPPTNDDPCTAFSLNPVTQNCNFITYTTFPATNSTVTAPSCGTYAGGDIWFEATVPASGRLTVDLSPLIQTEGEMAIYTGTNCNTISELRCVASTWSNPMPSIQIYQTDGLANQTIWIRVWEPGNDNQGSFEICAYETPPPPANDDPCGAISLLVDTICNYVLSTTQSATGSTTPAPSCATGYNGGDVWFTAIVPTSGLLTVSVSAGVATDGGIAIYSGTNCNNLTEVECNESIWTMPGNVTILTSNNLAGQTVWIRFWEGDDDNPGTFNICVFEPPTPLEVDTSTYTPNQLVQNILITGCLTASNIVYTGDPQAIGYFYNGTGAIGFSDGIVMSSGKATDAIGNGNNTLAATSFMTSGDANLDAIIAPTTTNDAAVLEFDFIPSSDTLKFNFVFGSEEYPEYVPSFNDVFAFFLSGPNPSGGNYVNQNIALIPGTITPVSIFNVNNGSGSPPTGPCVNCTYYVDNYSGNYPVTLDGFTVPITAIALVNHCQQYHIKLAIADALDWTLDSQVFLEAGSFTSGGQVLMTHHSATGISNQVLEGCQNYYVFSRLDTTDLSDSLLVTVSITGSATMGADYSSFPTSFYIPVGQIYDTLFYSAFIDNLVEGTENIIITLTNGCPCNLTTTVDTIFVYDNFSLNPTISNDTIICAGQSVTINSSVNPNFINNPGLVSYSWSTGAITSSINVSPLTTTIYTVTINDPCFQDTTLSMTITITPGITPDFYVTDDTICIGETTTAIFNNVVSTTAIYTWTFNSGNPLSANGVGPHNVSWNNSGTYNVHFHYTDLGCIGDSTIRVYVSPDPTYTFTPVDLSCYNSGNGSITVTPTGIGLPYTYNWSNGQTGQTINNLIAGSYNVTVTNAEGCTYSSGSLVSQPTSLSSSLTSINVLCFGGNDGSATVTPYGGIPPYTYLWSDILSQTTQTAFNLSAGTYYVTVTDSNLCTTVSNITINQPNALLTSSISGNNVTCHGLNDGKINLAVNGGTLPYSYLWSNGATTQSLQNLVANTYTVTVTDFHQCTTTNSFTIIEPTNLTYNISTIPVSCFGLQDGSASITVQNGTPPYSYLWSNGSTNPSNMNLYSGNYSVTVTDNSNCSFNTSVFVYQPSQVFAGTVSSITICIGDTTAISASATGGVSPYTYQWSTGETNSTIYVSPHTTTFYNVIATDINGCHSNISSVKVAVRPPITAEVTSNTNLICEGNSAILYVTATGGNGNYIYSFDNGTIFTPPVSVYPSVNTTFYIHVNDNCGSPEGIDTVTINVHKAPAINFASDIVNGCEPLTVHFNEFSIDQGLSYLWNFGDYNNNNISTHKNPVHTFVNAGTYNITLTITSLIGCTASKTISNMITVYERPQALFLTQPNVASIINSQIYFENNSILDYCNFWSFGDGDSSNIRSIIHKYPNIPGIYEVTLIVESIHRCKDTIKGIAEIVDEYTFYVPTAFSPDEDGMNDIFNIKGNGIDTNDFKMIIYDRWGEPVFETSNLFEGWNGKIKNSSYAEVGVYTWLIFYKDYLGNEYQKAGIVTLIR